MLQSVIQFNIVFKLHTKIHFVFNFFVVKKQNLYALYYLLYTNFGPTDSYLISSILNHECTLVYISVSQPVGHESLNKGSHRSDIIKCIYTKKPFI